MEPSLKITSLQDFTMSDSDAIAYRIKRLTVKATNF